MYQPPRPSIAACHRAFSHFAGVLILIVHSYFLTLCVCFHTDWAFQAFACIAIPTDVLVRVCVRACGRYSRREKMSPLDEWSRGPSLRSGATHDNHLIVVLHSLFCECKYVIGQPYFAIVQSVTQLCSCHTTQIDSAVNPI